MKIATLNIENLYHRDKSLIRKDPSKCVSDWVSELDSLIPRIRKSENEMDRIRELSFLLGFGKFNKGLYGVLRKRQGNLYLKLGDVGKEMKASELTDWNGWIALSTVDIDKRSTYNKAKLIAESDADIILLQEVEDRSSLVDFNNTYLRESNILPYEQVMVLEGNDSRGLSLGIMLKNGYRLDSVKSHGIYTALGTGPLFDIDCQEYGIRTPKGENLYILSMQFSADDPAKRKFQAGKVSAIYEKMRADGKDLILVCGTLNDTSFGDSLSPIFDRTDLVDVCKHPTFKTETETGKGAGYFSLGAYGMGVNIRQKDHLLPSYDMADKMTASGLDRRAMWPDRNSNWTLFPSLKNKDQEASSHPLIWRTFDIG
ncbi:MAG TPA: hypothetical protein VLZ54_01605 [Arenibacter sp.]|nr:hypothetical protein [Arenibacter sp.]